MMFTSESDKDQLTKRSDESNKIYTDDKFVEVNTIENETQIKEEEIP